MPTDGPSDEPPVDEPKAGEAPGLVVMGNSVARFIAGACDAPGTAKLDLSVDGGKKFAEIGLPLEEKADDNGDRGGVVTTILGVTITSPQELTLIARDADCDEFRFTTENGGQEEGQRGRGLVCRRRRGRDPDRPCRCVMRGSVGLADQ